MKALRFTGALAALSPDDRRALLSRGGGATEEAVRTRTAEILRRVRQEGDAALHALAQELDGVTLASLEVPKVVCEAALAKLEAPLRAALERAVRNLTTAQRAFLPTATEVETEPGVWVGRRPDPLERVGVYAPGGRAAYPSSVLMGIVPAKVAGVKEVVLCSPPGKDGLPSSVVLAAAAIAGADRVFALGGAGAIAALAYGTQSVPRVDRLVGPGNAYVAEAKVQCAGQVAIDAPAGPSELLAIADESADVASLCAELLAQAEHDPDAAVVALTTSEAQARALEAALSARLPAEPRRELISQALSRRGAVLTVKTLEEACAFANAFAAEHLLLAVRSPDALLPSLRNAGTVFLGQSASVAFGDYLTGANHVLPTAGAARSFSGLSSADCVRWTSTQRVTPAAAAALAQDAALLARSEGLHAHAQAALASANVPPAHLERSRGGAPIRAAYREISLYAPNRAPCAVDLSDNTNLYGIPPGAERALREAATPAVTRYPALYADALKRALAAYIGVAPEAIVTGCGSDDVLDSAIRAFAEPGDALAYPDPSFAMMPLFAKMNALVPRAVPLKADLDIDAEGLLATGAQVIYLCAPNNPTGTLASERAVRTVLERARGVVILDEAYAEYAPESWAARAPSLPRLLVVRTLSKAFGLAGLRVGYAVGASELVAEVEKSRGPYKVSALAERAAVAALTEDLPWVRERISDVLANRDRLARALAQQGLPSLPSAANFLYVPVPDAAALAAKTRERGVAVRPFVKQTRVGDGLRISLGPWELMEKVLAVLQEVRR